VSRVVGVGQHLGVAVRQPEAPVVLRCGGVLDLEEAGDRLLLEPLACVALVDAGALCEPGRRQRAAGQRVVEAEPEAEVHAVELERADRRFEEPPHQRVAPLVGRPGTAHGACLLVSNCAKPYEVCAGPSAVGEGQTTEEATKWPEAS
jgi:hypothetical protein